MEKMRFLRVGSLFVMLFSIMLFLSPCFAEEWTGVEFNTNRPGMDYRVIKGGLGSPQACRDECNKDPRCKAWSYVVC